MNSGLIFINKPKGFTSRDVVNIVAKKLKTKKVGHCGTLDPLATGVLVLCVGSATKLVPYLTSSNKEYIVTMEFGRQTTTGDLEGEIVEENSKIVSFDELNEVLNNFPKNYIQEVPIYSAVKVDGKKLYEYARNNIEVELPKREVSIHSLSLNSYSNQTFEFTTLVSKGTYIRSLVVDIAKKLDTVAVMTNLIRSKQGSVKLEECQDIDDDLNLISIDEVSLDMEKLILNDEQYNDVRYGRKIANINMYSSLVACYYHNKLIAIYEVEDQMLKCKRGINIENN